MMAWLFALLGVSCFTEGAVLPPPKSLVARSYDSSDLYANWPTYDELPLHPCFPTKAAWGVWAGNDELGALNHITDATILAAKDEIKLGKAINLNLELDIPRQPLNPTRPPMIHAIIPFTGYQDDIITINTQISTQFDGLRHFPYSARGDFKTYQFYNDLITFEEMMSPKGPNTLGIQKAAQKGIAGRGILLDWAGWIESKNESYNAFSGTSITTTELDQVAAWQGLDASSYHPGDFLIVRTGFTKQYSTLSEVEKSVLAFREGPDLQWIGVQASDQTLAWLWEKKVSMVGSDNPAFESVPPLGVIDGVHRSLHEIFISGWGQSIVEYLDLERLAEECHSINKFTFFFTLQNLNVVGGVASPPNAIAIL